MIIKNPNIAIYGKVRIEDIIRVKRDTPNYIKQPLRNKIKSYHVDYVLLDKLNYSVICAIELQDSTHNKNYQIIPWICYQLSKVTYVEGQINLQRYYYVVSVD